MPIETVLDGLGMTSDVSMATAVTVCHPILLAYEVIPFRLEDGMTHEKTAVKYEQMFSWFPRHSSTSYLLKKPYRNLKQYTIVRLFLLVGNLAQAIS